MKPAKEETSRRVKEGFHLAGLIPVEAQPLDFNMPWSDALMPIGQNYLAVERAVYECASAGCETIWIICSRETTPIIRHRIGDWVYDPNINVSVLRHTHDPSSRLKQIPIFYIPIHPKDKQKRTGLAWSILYGYNRAYQISRMFSRWSTPGKYYVVFPHGIYPPSVVRKHRLKISSPTSFYTKSPDGKTALDGELLSFSFDITEAAMFKKNFRNEEQILFKSGMWKDGAFVGEKLPIEQRFTGRFVKLETLLQGANIVDENTMTVKWYYDISSWDKYCTFLASPDRLRLKFPSSVLKYREFNPIGLDSLEDENLLHEEEFDMLDEIE